MSERGGLLVCNYLNALVLELQTIVRANGKSSIRNPEFEDMVSLTIKAAVMAGVQLAGTDWIPRK